MKTEEINNYLKENNIKSSHQRLKIFDYLITNKNHPTVDKIYQDLKGEMSTLSKTTIYNTLKLFAEKKIVQVITVEEKETRYDADRSLHGHFKCTECGEVYDIKINEVKEFDKELDGFRVDEEHIYFKGICKKCLENKKNKKT